MSRKYRKDDLVRRSEDIVQQTILDVESLIRLNSELLEHSRPDRVDNSKEADIILTIKFNMLISCLKLKVQFNVFQRSVELLDRLIYKRKINSEMIHDLAGACVTIASGLIEFEYISWREYLDSTESEAFNLKESISSILSTIRLQFATKSIFKDTENPIIDINLMRDIKPKEIVKCILLVFLDTQEYNTDDILQISEFLSGDIQLHNLDRNCVNAIPKMLLEVDSKLVEMGDIEAGSDLIKRFKEIFSELHYFASVYTSEKHTISIKGEMLSSQGVYKANIPYLDSEDTGYTEGDPPEAEQISVSGSGSFASVSRVIIPGEYGTFARKTIRIDEEEDSGEIKYDEHGNTLDSYMTTEDFLKELYCYHNIRSEYIASYRHFYYNVIDMEYYPTTLWNEISNGISESRTIDIMLGICKGLKVIHDACIIDCDLKPSNIMLTKDGTPKIIDFGSVIIRKLTELQPTSKIQTISVRAPEVHTKKYPVTYKVDIWSVGSIYYQILHKQYPIDIYKEWNQFGGDPHKIIGLVKDKINMFNIPILKKCLEIVPNNRPDVEELIGALREAENVMR